MKQQQKDTAFQPADTFHGGHSELQKKKKNLSVHTRSRMTPLAAPRSHSQLQRSIEWMRRGSEEKEHLSTRKLACSMFT